MVGGFAANHDPQAPIIAANGYTHERGISLAADVIGAIVPGVTGLGAAVRVANRADDAIAAARAAERAAAAKKAEEARQAAAAEKAEDAARKAADAQQAEAARRTVPVSKQCSFSPDTPVLTPDGPVPIGAVTVGDTVLAYHEASDTLGSYPVVAVWSHRDPIRVTLTLDGETIATTPEHPFRVVGVGWVPAALLQPGDLIHQADGTPGRLRAIHVAEQPAVMDNITVATAHTSFVGDGGWLVHNACKPDVHLNSRSSTAPHHVYEMSRTDKAGNTDIWKYGISGKPLKSDGTSPRLQEQLKDWNALNNGYTYSGRVLTYNVPGRSLADELEIELVTMYAERNAKGYYGPPGNIRPQPRPR